MQESAEYRRARRQVRRIREFYQHLLSYLVVNAVLFAINMLTDRKDLWFHWPLLGWGIAVVMHGFSVFARGGIWGRDWEERKIRQIMEKETGRSGS